LTWTYAENRVFPQSVVSGMVFIAVLWLLLGGMVKSLPPVIDRPGEQVNRSIIAAHFILIMIPLIAWIAPGLLETFSAPPRLAILVSRVLLALSAVALLASIYSFYGFYRWSPRYFTVTCHAVGIVVFLGTLRNIYGHMSSPEVFKTTIMLALAAYAVTLLITLAGAGFTSRGKRRA
jgi:hypothetical protein